MPLSYPIIKMAVSSHVKRSICTAVIAPACGMTVKMSFSSSVCITGCQSLMP